MIKWWGKRGENEVAWRVNIGDLKKGFDLDVKNHSGAGQAVPRLIATLPPNLQERVTAFRKAVRLEPSLDEWDILSAIARICA